MEKTSTTTDARRTNTREVILLVASQLFAERGYRGTSTREIARAVGVKQPAIFHHFPSKQAIMSELLSAGVDESLSFAERLQAEDGRASVRLYRLLRFDTRILCSSPYNLSGLFDTVIYEPEFKAASERYRRLLSLVEAMVREGIDRGEFIEIDVGFVVGVLDWLNERTIRDAALRRTSEGTPAFAGTRMHAVPVAHIPDMVASFALRAILSHHSSLDDIRRSADAEDARDAGRG